MIMSKFEGFTSISFLERRSASRHYIFNFVNVFLGSIIAGSAFKQLNEFSTLSAKEYVDRSFFHIYGFDIVMQHYISQCTLLL